MIGGYDWDSKLEDIGHGDIDFLLRYLTVAWQEGIIETSDGSEVRPIREWLGTSWPFPIELFVYRSREAYEAWTRDGFSEEFAEDMVTLYGAPDYITFVVNEKGSASHATISQAIDNLRRNRRNFLPQSTAA